MIDQRYRRIRKIDPAGTITTVAVSEFDLLGVAVDTSGIVYVHSSRDLHRIDASGTISLIHRSGAGIRAIAIDDAGDVILGLEDRIVKVNARTVEESVLAGTGDGNFKGNRVPARSALLEVAWRGIAVDRDGRVWFADAENRRIRVVESRPNSDESALPGMAKHARGEVTWLGVSVAPVRWLDHPAVA